MKLETKLLLSGLSRERGIQSGRHPSDAHAKSCQLACRIGCHGDSPGDVKGDCEKRLVSAGRHTFQSLKGAGFKSNYYCLETGEDYWISGPKRRGGDRLYGSLPVEIDDDVRSEYWRDIRRQPEKVDETKA